MTQTPGINRTRLCEQVGYGWSAVGHHLRILEERGLVASEQVGRNRAFFRRDIPEEYFQALALLSEPREGEILQIVRELPGLKQDHLFQKAPLSRRILYRVIDSLEQVGLLMRRDAQILPGPRLDRVERFLHHDGSRTEIDPSSPEDGLSRGP